jgi:hypothetical protein
MRSRLWIGVLVVMSAGLAAQTAAAGIGGAPLRVAPHPGHMTLSAPPGR